MKMIRHNVAYRFANGDVEGFSVFRFDRLEAELCVIDAIRHKCIQLKEIYNPENLITSNKGLSKKEKSQIQQDWKTYRGPGEGPHPSTGKIGFFG